MAVVSVSFDGVRMHDMGDSDGTTGIGSSGGGASPGSEPDFYYQGSAAISKKVGTSPNGIDVDTSAFATPRSVDMTASNRKCWFIKAQTTNFKALEDAAGPGGEFWLGSSSTDYYRPWFLVAYPLFYPDVGGWNLMAWNPNVTATQKCVAGTPSLSAVDYFALDCDFKASSRAENVILDAIDVGRGLVLTGGDSTDPDGTWEDFVSTDEGTANNRWGCFSTKEGIIYSLGKHWIGRNTSGTAVATVFADTEDRTIVFPRTFNTAGDTGIGVDLGNASTNVSWTSAIIGRGDWARVRFNTETDISSANDTIAVQEMVDRFKPADLLVARSNGGTETWGVSNGIEVFVGWDMTAASPSTVHLYASGNCLGSQSGLYKGTGGTPVDINLTASSAGNGEIWYLESVNNTKPELEVVGTSGTFSLTGGVLENFSEITLTSACTLTNVEIKKPDGITQSGAVIDGCSIIGQNTMSAEYLIDANDLADIKNNSFNLNGQRGHAIRGTQTGTIAFQGNVFTGYFSVTDQTKHQFDNTSAVNSTNDTITLPAGHGYSTGDAVVYSKALTANTVISGLTDQTKYYLNVSTNDVTLHLNEGDAINNNAAINITAGTGNETHALWPASAAFFNDSGGALTLTVSNGGGTPSVRNALNSTTTVQNAVTLTVNVEDENGDPVSGARVRIENASTGALITNGTTNASGVYSDATYNYTADLGVLTKVRLKGYKFYRAGGTITSSGITVGATLNFNRIVDLP